MKSSNDDMRKEEMFENVDELFDRIEKREDCDNIYLIHLNFSGSDTSLLIGFENKEDIDKKIEGNNAAIIEVILKNTRIVKMYLKDFLIYSWLKIIGLKLEENKLSIIVENNTDKQCFELSMIFDEIEWNYVKQIEQIEYLNIIQKAKGILTN